MMNCIEGSSLAPCPVRVVYKTVSNEAKLMPVASVAGVVVFAQRQLDALLAEFIDH
jgi:hypothetical protein